MNKNVKIAKELVRLAKSLIAMNNDETEYIENAMAYIDECFNQNYVVSKKSGIKYNVRYVDRNFNLVALEGRNDIPDDEHVDEDEIVNMYNEAVADLSKDYHTLDGYDTIRTLCFESNENDYMLNNYEYTVTDRDGNVIDTTDEFDDDVNNDTKDLCFDYINNHALVDFEVYINFICSNGKDSGVTQELDASKFNSCEKQ